MIPTEPDPVVRAVADLDPAVEAAAWARVDRWGYRETLDEAGLATLIREMCENVNLRGDIEAAAPLIRAQERAAVRAELLAAVDEWTAEAIARQRQNLSSERLSIFADAAEVLADRIAPEHVTPREKP